MCVTHRATRPAKPLPVCGQPRECPGCSGEAAKGEIKEAVVNCTTVLQREGWTRTWTELHHHSGGNIVQLLPNAVTDVLPWKSPFMARMRRQRLLKLVFWMPLYLPLWLIAALHCLKNEVKDMFLWAGLVGDNRRQAQCVNGCKRLWRGVCVCGVRGLCCLAQDYFHMNPCWNYIYRCIFFWEGCSSP